MKKVLSLVLIGLMMVFIVNYSFAGTVTLINVGNVNEDFDVVTNSKVQCFVGITYLNKNKTQVSAGPLEFTNKGYALSLNSELSYDKIFQSIYIRVSPIEKNGTIYTLSNINADDITCAVFVDADGNAIEYKIYYNQGNDTIAYKNLTPTTAAAFATAITKTSNQKAQIKPINTQVMQIK